MNQEKYEKENDLNKYPMCLLERTLIEAGFRCYHDGQRSPTGQFELPPEEVRVFCRKYQLHYKGEPRNRWAVFKYDGRKSLVDFDLRSKEPDLAGRESIQLNYQEGVVEHG